MSDNEMNDADARSRAGARDSLLLLTTLCSPDGKELGRGRIRNLSATGMMVDCDMLLSRGMKLTSNIRGVGNVTGEVVRVEQGRFGIRFDQEIDPALARKPVTAKTGGSQEFRPR
ncbi:MAG: PilZ domain-containing protein [Sphingobium sp.]|nr:PilZ domain-containing protein [Sphingobium sp.]